MAMKIKLTKKNYYGRRANQYYWSASLVKEFLDCPERAMATLNGKFERESSSALLVGSYVDSYFEGPKSFELFKSTHPEILKKDGTLKAEYVKADEMIRRAKSDKVFMEYMQGRKQVIKTGEIAGIPFKCKFDVYKQGERIVDLKTVKDLNPVYKPGQGRLNFADAWNWPLQMAIYQAIEGNQLPCYLAVITKEDPPALELIQIPQSKLDAELEFLKEKLPYFDAIKQGVINPERCESCAYCRQTKVIKAPVVLDDYNEIGGSSNE